MWRIEELVGHAHADDGADHGVGAGGRQTEPPGAQVPQDGGNQQRKDHGKAGAGADLENEFDGQQRDDRKSDRAGGGEHAGQIAHSRPDHGDVGFERMGVDDRSHGVGGVVEAVDELEAEGDQQCQGQQQIGPDAGDGHVVQVFGHMKADVAEADHEGR